MYKPPKIDWKATNIAALGSDEEKKARLQASEHEPAWKNAGKKEGVEIWRVVNFKVVPWPTSQYGKFYANDSYIVLSTKKNDNEFDYDLHFWLGNTTTADEAGTAAYKTVELDDNLGGTPVEYREVQGFESKQFVSYFPNGLQYLEGGAPTGFTKGEKVQDRPRLFIVTGLKKTVRVFEVPLSPSSLNASDVFLLDSGEEVFQWNGSRSSPQERIKAAQVATGLGYDTDVIEEDDQTGEEAQRFYKILGGVPSSLPTESSFHLPPKREANKLIQVESDGSGKFNFKERTPVAKSSLSSEDICLFDIGDRVFVWIGKNASPNEKQYALTYAQEYLIENNLPPYTVLIRMAEGHETMDFKRLVQ